MTIRPDQIKISPIIKVELKVSNSFSHTLDNQDECDKDESGNLKPNKPKNKMKRKTGFAAELEKFKKMVEALSLSFL